MDHKTLFPVLEMGFCIWDIHVKPAKGTDYRLWQEIVRQQSVNFEANFEHIINFTEVKRIYRNLASG
jgi:hypothetical protein